MTTDESESFPVVVIGGSAGAIAPLQRIMSGLPPDFAAPIFVVTHTPPDSVSALPHILARAGELFATHAIDGAPIARSNVFVAPPDRHLTVERGVMRVMKGARENGHRPSIDVLFRSAAQVHGSRCCAVLLSGTLDDGIAGLQAVRAAGGRTIVQEPDDAQFPDMPNNALRAGVVDETCASSEIPEAIAAWLQAMDMRSPRAAYQQPDEREEGAPSVYTCPDCGGTLWELDTQATLRFRCRTGHAFSQRSLLSSQTNTVEAALWSAIRILEERRDLLRRIAGRAENTGDNRTSARLRDQADRLLDDIRMIYDSIDEVTKRLGVG